MLNGLGRDTLNEQLKKPEGNRNCMDNTVWIVLLILLVAAALAATFWRATQSTRRKIEKDDERSAREHRKLTRRYRKERDRLGE